jgi:membrane glycosyltransferase
MEQQRAPSTMGIATKYGLIQGVLSFLVSTASTMAGIRSTWVSVLFHAALIAVLMVLAHREFKRSHGGIMMYSEGLGSGTLISIVAAVVTAVLAYVYLKYINSGYLAAAIQAQQAALEQRGITGPQARQAMGIIGAVMTPVGVAVLSLLGAVIVGFIVALIVSIFTQSETPRK